MLDSFLTITKTTEGFYKEKGSKFIAYAIPVEDEDEVKEQLEQLKKQYYDARHHCYAYILGADQSQFRANDDGEPNHSAGDPILGQIRSKEITNTLVVVVRYFGGTKLGVGGLINAYKTAAADALDQNEIVEKKITKKLRFSFPYEEMNEVMKLVKDFDLEIKKQDYQVACILVANIIVSLEEQLRTKVQLLNDLGHDIKLDD